MLFKLPSYPFVPLIFPNLNHITFTLPPQHLHVLIPAPQHLPLSPSGGEENKGERVGRGRESENPTVLQCAKTPLVGKMTSSATPGRVLCHVSAFLDEVIPQPDLYHRILSLALQNLPLSTDSATLHTFSKASQNVEEISGSKQFSPFSPSFHSAEQLLSLPNPNALSAFLRSLISFLRRRTKDSTTYLLNIFSFNPSSARHDIAPSLFENLFVPHLLMAQWFAGRRSQILSSIDEEENCSRGVLISMEAVTTMSLLSRMSRGQATELKELEAGYEEVVDDNTRVYVKYLKEILEASYNIEEGGDQTMAGKG